MEDSEIGEATVRSHVSAILREGLASLDDADLPP